MPVRQLHGPSQVVPQRISHAPSGVIFHALSGAIPHRGAALAQFLGRAFLAETHARARPLQWRRVRFPPSSSGAPTCRGRRTSSPTSPEQPSRSSSWRQPPSLAILPLCRRYQSICHTKYKQSSKSRLMYKKSQLSKPAQAVSHGQDSHPQRATSTLNMCITYRHLCILCAITMIAASLVVLSRPLGETL